MALFRVTQILNGNRIKVEGWLWNGHEGTDVIIAGYNLTNSFLGTNESINRINQDLAVNRLSSLILTKEVELGRVLSINEDGSITCIVYYNGVDIAKYFPEYNQAHI